MNYIQCLSLPNCIKCLSPYVLYELFRESSTSLSTVLKVLQFPRLLYRLQRVSSISICTLWTFNRNEQFFLFPQCFPPFWITFRHSHQTQNCCLQTPSVWKSLKFVVCKVLRVIKTSIIMYSMDCIECPSLPFALNGLYTFFSTTLCVLCTVLCVKLYLIYFTNPVFCPT